MVASDGVRAMMESALTARDRVGVQDFVLLENYTSEAAFIENLRKRFKENLIYVSGVVVDKVFSVVAQTKKTKQTTCVFFPRRRTSVRFWCR